MRPEVIRRQTEEAHAILRLTQRAVAEGRAADQILAAHWRANRHFGSRDRRFFSAVVFAYFRWKGWIDRIADVPTALTAACWLDGETQFPALEHWAPRPTPLAPESSLVEKARALAAWQNWEQAPGIHELFPAWTFDELLGDGSPDFVARLAHAFQRRPPLWLRCRAGQREAVSAHLARAGFACQADPRVANALRVNGAPGSDALRPIVHRLAEVQDIASQAVGIACAPKANERWWDVCAGAGGKTLQLLDTLDRRGHVLCTDVRAAALDELAHRAHMAGFSHFVTRQVAEDPAEWAIADRFDGILLDAPCSGIGTWSRAPDARWRTTLAQLDEHRQRQIALLRHAVRHLQPGGRLIYAVCSLSKRETTGVLEAVQAEHPALRPTLTQSITPDFGPGIGMWFAVLEKSK